MFFKLAYGKFQVVLQNYDYQYYFMKCFMTNFNQSYLYPFITNRYEKSCSTRFANVHASMIGAIHDITYTIKRIEMISGRILG